MSDYLQRAKFFRTKKRLGQNFLVNPDVIESSFSICVINKNDTGLVNGAGICVF